jgi:ligand-binding sensor domain-containing protein/signal transduction histidine kinase/ActR/RegA family two-component response regulator
MSEAVAVHRHAEQGRPRPASWHSCAIAALRCLLWATVTFSILLVDGESARAIEPRSPGRFVTDVWQTEQGLPQNSVSAICQTRDGYLWLGTYSGLVRFDGVRFTVFEPGNTPGLLGNRITALLEDSSGGLWIGSESGLSLLKQDHFLSYTTQDGLPDNVIQSISQDRQGTVWIGTKAGLACLRNATLISFDFGGVIPTGHSTFTYEDPDGALWVAANGDLFSLSEGAQSMRRIGAIPSGAVASICGTRDRSLWIATADHLYRLKQGALSDYSKEAGLLSNIVLALTEDHDGNLWIGTDSGLNCWREGQIRAYTAKDGLSDARIKAITQGSEGDLWIGTDGGGLDRWKHPRVTAYTQQDGLPESSVVPVLQDRDGSLWIGAACGGLIRFYNGIATTFTKRNGLPNECIWSLAEDRDGIIWVGTFGGGLARFKDGRFTIYTQKDGLPSLVVLSLYVDRTGLLWIGTDHGLGMLRDGRITTYTVKDGLVNDNVKFIMEDRAGALWIATAGGLGCLKEGKFTNYTTADGLSFNSVRAIHEDSEGNLWIGTYGGGLNRLKGGKFTRYTTQEGLLDNTVSRILEDYRGNLWMNGNNGISRVSKLELNEVADGSRKSVSAITYGVADGMKSREGNGGGQPAGWKSRDGKMWFPTVRGLVSVDPQDDYGPPPPLAIEGVLVNGKPVDLANQNIIGPGATEVEFHYTALSFQNPGRVQFKYQLEGYDKEWVVAGTRRAAYYTNLEPGPYSFRVIASNSEGVWNQIGTAVQFRLRPHFYRTKVFYALSILAVVFGAYALYSQGVRKLKARAEELSMLVVQRTRAEAALRDSNRYLEEALDKLHKAQQQIIQQERLRALGQMASGVAHDFNNALAPILGYSELLLVSPEALDDKEKVIEELGIINTAAKDAAKVVSRLRQFFRRRQQGDMLVPVELRKIIDQAISLAQPRWKNEAWARGVTITVRTDLESVPTVLGDEAELRELLINLIFNAIDAMPVGGEILFGTFLDGDQVAVVVSDTGAGMTDEVRRRCLEPFFTTKNERGTGLGLASAYGTIQRHRGTIEVESQQGRGTTFKIRLPIRSAMEGAQTQEPTPSPLSLQVQNVGDEPVKCQVVPSVMVGLQTLEPNRPLSSLQAPLVNDESLKRQIFPPAKVDIQTQESTPLLSQPVPQVTDEPLAYQALPSMTGDGEETEEPTPSLLSLHVLLVDDEPQVRALLVEYLAIDGHTVETAANGNEGLERFRLGTFDLVVTDMAMPEMNGNQLSEAIEKINPGTPVIMLTGFGELMNAEGTTHSGKALVVGKPITLAAFRQAVSQVTRTTSFERENESTPV